MEIKNKIREAADKKILFLSHALRQMSREDRMISTKEVREVVRSGEIIEDYPEDARGHSCLMLGWVNKNRAIHVDCAPKDDYLAIITAYLPRVESWSERFTKRKIS